MSKKLSGKCISNKLRLTATSGLRDFIFEGFQTLLQILRNTFEIFMTAIQGPRANKPLNANGIICCINTW
jgi:hypothetical protein